MTPKEYIVQHSKRTYKAVMQHLWDGDRSLCVDMLVFEATNRLLVHVGWKLTKTDIGKICNIQPLEEEPVTRVL